FTTADGLRRDRIAVHVVTGHIPWRVESFRHQQSASIGLSVARLDSSTRSRADIRMDWNLHHRHRLLLDSKTPDCKNIWSKRRLGLLGVMDGRSYASMGD